MIERVAWDGVWGGIYQKEREKKERRSKAIYYASDIVIKKKYSFTSHKILLVVVHYQG